MLTKRAGIALRRVVPYLSAALPVLFCERVSFGDDFDLFVRPSRARRPVCVPAAPVELVQHPWGTTHRCDDQTLRLDAPAFIDTALRTPVFGPKASGKRDGSRENISHTLTGAFRRLSLKWDACG